MSHFAGNTREKALPNGDATTTSFDALGRRMLIEGPLVGGNPLYVYENHFDLSGNVLTIEESYPGGQLHDRTLSNNYDALYRLREESISGTDAVVTTYTYDDANNRLRRVERVNSVVTVDENNTVNLLNQVTQMDDAVTGESTFFAYDLNGDRISEHRYDSAAALLHEHALTFDYENRLVTYHVLSDAGAGALPIYRYDYDYRTRRVLRDESSEGGSDTLVSFSGGTSVQEYDDGATTPSVEYVRGSDYGGGIGGILYTLRSGEPSFNHYNSRGDVVAKTDGNGSLTYQAAYEAFGKHGDTASSQEWGTNPNRQQANTKDEDPTGLLNEGFRYRDLKTGTFLTRDPLGMVDGPNVYTYVNQNPWSKFDPRGLSASVVFVTPTPVDDAAVGGAFGTAAFAASVAILAGRQTFDLHGKMQSQDKSKNPYPQLGSAANDSVDKGAQQSGNNSQAAMDNKSQQAEQAGQVNAQNQQAIPEATQGDISLPEASTNPFNGPVDSPVNIVDEAGNVVPIGAGEQLKTSPDGKWAEVKDSDGKPVGKRLDQGHKSHTDPRAQEPHTHRDDVGAKNDDGSPWLPRQTTSDKPDQNNNSENSRGSDKDG